MNFNTCFSTSYFVYHVSKHWYFFIFLTRFESSDRFKYLLKSSLAEVLMYGFRGNLIYLHMYLSYRNDERVAQKVRWWVNLSEWGSIASAFIRLHMAISSLFGKVSGRMSDWCLPCWREMPTKCVTVPGCWDSSSLRPSQGSREGLFFGIEKC